MAFGFSEPGLPTIPLAVAWESTPQTQNGTLSSASVNITTMTSTAGLYPGIPVSGTGITPGSVIATIVSSTAITLNQPTISGTTGAQALTFSTADLNQSIWSGPAYGGFPTPSFAAISTDTPDCAWNIPDVQVLATASTYVPAPGRGLVTVLSTATAGAGIQYNINGSWVTVFTGTVSATSSVYIMTDGTNVRFNSLTSATGATYTFYRERSSKSTSI
jgi:hypothetical protein